MTDESDVFSGRTTGQVLNDLRMAAGWRMKDLALAAGFSNTSSIQRYVDHQYNLPLKPEIAEKFANAFRSAGIDPTPVLRLSIDHVMQAVASDQAPASPANARVVTGNVDLGNRRTIPVYGQAIGGANGQFEFNGQEVAKVLAPPMLQGIPDAYAVMIVGDSMEPRYFAGETAYIHPRRPVRKGDFVVVQVASSEHNPPDAYVKQFISRNEKELKLRQINPEKELRFPSDRVKSIHKIVMSGTDV